MSSVAYIALGSNLGDRHAVLERARQAIATLPGTRVVATTRIEETEPVGPPGQPRYLNQMARVTTALAPHELLRELQRIENSEGRVRIERWGARTLDLDIVDYVGCEMNTPDLTIPHPELRNRDFWRRELYELLEAHSD